MGDLKKSGNQALLTDRSSGFILRLRQIERLTGAVLRRLNLRNTLVSVVFVSDAKMKRLNQKYLNHPWTTDVLAFPFSNGALGRTRAGAVRFLGEIIICPKQAELYAKEQGFPTAEELFRYLCHGILHLIGYSDRSGAAKKKMRRMEDRLIKQFTSKLKRII